MKGKVTVGLARKGWTMLIREGRSGKVGEDYVM
jgi:hypothetical protein